MNEDFILRGSPEAGQGTARTQRMMSRSKPSSPADVGLLRQAKGSNPSPRGKKSPADPDHKSPGFSDLENSPKTQQAYDMAVDTAAGA